MDKLVIKEGEKVWTVMIDIYPINDDGNLIDAATIGAILALRKAKMPVLDKDGKIDYHKESKEPLPVSKETHPFSFSFFKLGNSIILDPTREEEDASDARLTLAVSCPKKDKIINSMQKGGITPLTIDELNTIIELSEKTYEELFPNTEKKIQKLVKKK